MYDFFSPDELELRSVISETLIDVDEVKSVQTIQTGWTNITMDVQCKKHDYIFRFPRNLFFAKMMIKDCIFCQFLRDKVSVNIPDMQLRQNKNRPFSMHKKIVGDPLIAMMGTLTPAQQNNIVKDLSVFLVQLHALPIETMPQQIKETLGCFLDGLASVHKGNYDFTHHEVLHNMEKETKNLSIIHGDFHPGNILIKDGRVSGIIDFSFASVSDRHSDLGRFVGRSERDLGDALVKAYQNEINNICDMEKINHVANVFKYVEYKYVQYMQSSHPEINIPHSVLQMAAQEAERFNNARV